MVTERHGRGRMARALGVTAAAVLGLGALTVWAAHGLGGSIAAGDGVAQDGVRPIALRVHTWGFSPNVIRVARGETVQFVVWSEDLRHGFAINELRLNLPLVPGKGVRSPAVTVDLPDGVYPIHCSVFCGLGHPSMKAKLVVGTPPASRAATLPWLASLLGVAMAAGFGALRWRA
jgi:cytochrome c oxidase subunit 2